MHEILILLATYNGEKYLSEQIDSILNQSYRDWHLILSDDGSTDSSPEILKGYAQKYPDRIEVYNSGMRFGTPQGHFLHLLEHFCGTAKYLMFCDQDDVWHSDKIEKTIGLMRTVSEKSDVPMLVHTDLNVVDKSMNPINPSFLKMTCLYGRDATLNNLLIQNIVTGSTMMMNHALAELVCSHLPPKLPMMHDWWIALAASAYGKILFLDEATVDYRQHGNNVLGAKDIIRGGGVIKKIIRGKETYTIFHETMKQAEMFGDVFDNELAAAFGKLQHEGKIKKIYFIIRNKIWKNSYNDFVARLGEILFI